MVTSKAGPAGSLQPLDTNRGKWTDGLGALEISTLGALADDINKAVDQTVKQVARGKIRVGKLLLEARGQFTEDQAFGKWRKDNTLIKSKQHAHYLMQVAEQFGNATVLIEGANYSVIQELVTADQEAIQWVVDRIDAGEPPTVQETRTKVRQTQAERLAPKGTNKKGAPKTGMVPIVPNAKINEIVHEELPRRIMMVLDRQIKGIEGDLIIIGMDPDPQCPCNPDILVAIDDYYETRASEEHYAILVRSINRVQEEFSKW